MSKKALIGLTLITAAIASTESQAIKFGKPVQTPVVITKSASHVAATAATKKQVTVMNVLLSDKERNMLLNGVLCRSPENVPKPI